MTVALYARRKSWPLEAVTVRLRHSKIHAADCADCETKEGMLDHIESDLEFAGRLTQEQRALPRTTTSFMSAIVSTPVGKRIFTNDSLLRMRMYLYRPILGSPHFWQTDKALVDWSTIHQRPKLACRGGLTTRAHRVYALS